MTTYLTEHYQTDGIHRNLASGIQARYKIDGMDHRRGMDLQERSSKDGLVELPADGLHTSWVEDCFSG